MVMQTHADRLYGLLGLVRCTRKPCSEQIDDARIGGGCIQPKQKTLYLAFEVDKLEGPAFRRFKNLASSSGK
jgi:hypothetical protein